MSYYDYNPQSTYSAQAQAPAPASSSAPASAPTADPNSRPYSYPPQNTSTSYYEPPVPGQEPPAPRSRLDPQQLEEIDNRSVFVGNVEFRSTAEELKHHFSNCGAINRVTIVTNKETGHPRGYGFIEFATKEGATNAVSLTDSVFFDRPLKVVAKRTYFLDSSAPRRPRGTRGPRRPGRGPYGGAPHGYAQAYPAPTAYVPVPAPHGAYVPATYPPAYAAYAVPAPAPAYGQPGPVYPTRGARPPRQYEPY